MILVKHENFPDGLANLIRHYEFQDSGETCLKFPQELCGDDIQPGQWISRIAKLPKARRPIILSQDDGTIGNAVRNRAMRDSGCSFILFMRAWIGCPFNELAWKSLKAWPGIVEEAKKCYGQAKHCRIDVSINGKVWTTNL